jgi:hypothetical protein
MTTATADRAAILEEIGQLEMKLAELRAMLPSPVKNFYCFRCHPESRVWVYAASREQANQRLYDRMNRAYGDSWNIASKSVQVYSNARDAAANSPGNLFRSLADAEAREFLADYRADQNGRAEQPKPKHVPKSQLEIDAEHFEKQLRQQQR